MKKFIEFLKYATLPRKVKTYKKKYEEYKKEEAKIIEEINFWSDMICGTMDRKRQDNYWSLKMNAIDRLNNLQEEFDIYYHKYINSFKKGA